MKQSNMKWFLLILALSALLLLGACGKKKEPPPPPPPPAPPAPTASISVDPSTIQSGGSASLTWQTSNATDVSIDGIGAVQPNGSQSVSPTDSTTYHLTAKGAGGTQEATARLTVTAPPPPPPPPTPSVTDEDLFAQNVKDVYFDYDKSDIRGDQQASIQADAQFLNQHVVLEVIRTFAVLCFLVVAATAGKVCSRRMRCTRKSPVTDAVAVHVFVAGKSAEFIEVFFAQHLSALDGCRWVRERV